jgi:hypothetical protein
VTKEEVAFCNLVSGHLGPETYSVVNLQRGPGGTVTFHVHRLGDLERQDKLFSVFSDDLLESVRTNRLPEGLQKDLQNSFMAPVTPWHR